MILARLEASTVYLALANLVVAGTSVLGEDG